MKHTKPKIQDYNAIVGHYMAYFIQKHYDIDDEKEVDYYWVADMVGTIVDINDMFFNFDDIRFDIDNDIDKDVIFSWYDYMMEQHSINPLKNINFSSYTKGARI